MSTPQDPRGEGQPAYNPYGQQGGYRAGQQPGQYASSPLPGQGYPPQPYPQQPYPAPGPYAGYDPYGGSAWGKPEPEPVRRPGLLVLALVLMVLAALPFLAGGVFLIVSLTAAQIPAEVLNDPRIVQAGGTPELVLQAFHLVAGIMVGVALLYVLLAVLAFRGRNWARIAAAVLTVGFVLLLLAGLVSGGSSGAVLGFVGFLLVATIGAVVILFLPDSNRYFARPR